MTNPIRLNEWRIQITNCDGVPMEIKLAAPESLSAQDVLVKLGAALDYPLEVLLDRGFGVSKGLDIMFTETPPIELFQKIRYKIETRGFPGCGWGSFHAAGDLRFVREADAKPMLDKLFLQGWSRENLRVVIAND
jgi:hypothetical protein